eukprot:snap_masked-scaffold_4-processed-gene-0.19-mRNA-1 protein AED:0.74 eAED:0.75 QI:0/-1/0/1/-1/1/1/0/855
MKKSKAGTPAGQGNSAKHYVRVIQFAKEIKRGVELISDCFPQDVTPMVQIIALIEQDFLSLMPTRKEEKNQLTKFYNDKDFVRLETALCNIHEHLTRIVPSSRKPTAAALKEMRTFLSFAYERVALESTFIDLFEVLSDLQLLMRSKGKQIVGLMKQMGEAMGLKLTKKDIPKLTDEARKQMQKMQRTKKINLSTALDSFDKLAKKISETEKKMNSAQDQTRYGLDLKDKANPFTKARNGLEEKLREGVDFETALDSERLLQFDNFIRTEIAHEEAEINDTSLFIKPDDVIGSGIFGEVTVGALDASTDPSRRNYVDVVMKALVLKEEIIKDEYTEYMNELQVWLDTSHKNLVKVYGTIVSEGSEYVHFIFERMKIDLDTLLKRGYKFSADVKEEIVIMICQGLLELHNNNIIHRNLKPANIFLTSDRPNDSRSYKVKLSDFGLGLFKYEQQTNGPNSYTPPEVIENSAMRFNSFGWTTAGDMYSVGLIGWDIWNNHPEERAMDDYQFLLSAAVVEMDKRPSFSAKPAERDDNIELVQILQKCWNKNPYKRPTPDEVIDALDPEEMERRMEKERRMDEEDVEDDRYSEYEEYEVEEDEGDQRSSHRDHNGGETDATIKEVITRKIKNFKKLNADLKRLTDLALSKEELNFDYASKFRVPFFSGGKKLTELDLKALSAIIDVNSKLKTLRLENRKIEVGGLASIVRTIAGHPHLVNVFLSGNTELCGLRPLLFKEYDKVDDDDEEPTFQIRKSNLKLIHASNIGMDDYGAEEIAWYLSENPPLQQLDISDNEIGSKGLNIMARNIEGNSNLRSLIVYGNKTKGTGYKNLKKAFEKKKKGQKKGRKLNRLYYVEKKK